VSDSGQGLVEYSVILSVIALALLAVLLVLRNSTGNDYNGARNRSPLGGRGERRARGRATGGHDK
jgi:hypothetical protein